MNPKPSNTSRDDHPTLLYGDLLLKMMEVDASNAQRFQAPEKRIRELEKQVARGY